MGKEYTQNIPLGVVLGVLFIYEIDKYMPFFNSNSIFPFYEMYTFIINIININFITYKIADIHESFNSVGSNADIQFHSSIEIQSIGFILYTNGMSFLLICSCILLLAIIGPITLSTIIANKYKELFIGPSS